MSRPLHFGDDGGLPLKIIWALLDLIAIALLGSDIYLWLARWRGTEQRMAELIACHSANAAQTSNGAS